MCVAYRQYCFGKTGVIVKVTQAEAVPVGTVHWLCS